LAYAHFQPFSSALLNLVLSTLRTFLRGKAGLSM
jgi:hypothetical protein